jgi:hypothetical protein
MSTRQRLFRVAIGLLVATLALVGGVLILQQFIPTWGATPAEAARVLPGDELAPNAGVDWTHAITINAPPDAVWPWIAQMGERRGAFYSYTFIENQMGNGDVYHNADRIVPEWQNTKPGDELIGGALPMRVQEVVPGEYMLGYMETPFTWVWGWHVEPLDANQTRLLVRMKIAAPQGMDNPILSTFIGLGGFVMENAMLQGIQARAEGSIPPSYSEPLEIILWFLALLAGVIAAVFFVMFQEWLMPLVTGLLAIGALLVFTFIQPPIWLRLFADLTLYAILAGIAVDQYLKRSGRSTASDPSGGLTLKPSALK